MKKLKSTAGFVPLIVLILLVSAIGIGTYLLKTGQIRIPASISGLSSPPPDLTADWKTYINSKNEYSIKYPPDWQEKLLCYGGRQEDNYVCILSPDFIENPGPDPVKQGGLISIGSIDESLGFGRTQSEFCTSTTVDKIQNCKEIMIGTLKGIQRSFTLYNFVDVGILENGKIIFTFRAFYTPDSKEKTLNSFFQILSTFKFTD